MKKIIKTVVYLIILIAIIYYKDDIVTWATKEFFFSDGIIVTQKNQYALNYEYLALQETDDFYAKSKKHLSDIIYTGLNNGSDSFYFYCDYDNCVSDLNEMSETDAFLNINNFVHPFNMYHKLYITITSFNKVTVDIVKTYNEQMITSVNEQINQIENEIITDNMTLKEKIKSFHDYIINTTDYDTEYINSNRLDYDSPVHNATGPLIYHQSLCGGYTDVMSVFLDRLNIPNYRISSELHIWNLVYIDNEWLHLDLTWDDPVTSDNTKMLIDKFFLINTNELESYETNYHSFDKNLYIEASN